MCRDLHIPAPLSARHLWVTRRVVLVVHLYQTMRSCVDTQGLKQESVWDTGARSTRSLHRGPWNAHETFQEKLAAGPASATQWACSGFPYLRRQTSVHDPRLIHLFGCPSIVIQKTSRTAQSGKVTRLCFGSGHHPRIHSRLCQCS